MTEKRTPLRLEISRRKNQNKIYFYVQDRETQTRSVYSEKKELCLHLKFNGKREWSKRLFHSFFLLKEREAVRMSLLKDIVEWKQNKGKYVSN